ncbi:hypothetical protein TRSC58_07255 [Trypanosoma rangeli SC58]|uniref:Uncharacterized protein n=1 Tax=Trypanosoma rangeli SC58 TaxID=429131 RepID=A0A061IS56_TRYRA|nr:hypothetical protein TRSC58_07255 [Trypanosoma rangeli SC58]
MVVEIAESPVPSKGKPSLPQVQGVGAGFVPHVLGRALVDVVIQVPRGAVINVVQRLPRTDGIFCVFFGGASVCVALQIARRP